MKQTKGTTRKEMVLDRWSMSAYEYERMGWGEQWLVVAHIRGTAGTMNQYCVARMTIYNDGQEELEYLWPADEDDMKRYR